MKVNLISRVSNAFEPGDPLDRTLLYNLSSGNLDSARRVFEVSDILLIVLRSLALPLTEQFELQLDAEDDRRKSHEGQSHPDISHGDIDRVRTTGHVGHRNLPAGHEDEDKEPDDDQVGDQFQASFDSPGKMLNDRVNA